MGTQAGQALSTTSTTSYLRRYRLIVLISVAAVSVAALLSLRHLRFEFNPQDVYRSDGQAYQFMQQHDRLFGRDDNVVVVLVHGRRVDDVEVLDYLRQARRVLAQVDGVARVDGLPSASLLAERDGGLAATPIVDEGPIDEDDLQRVREAATDPLLGGVIVSGDLQTAALFAVLEPSLFDLQQLQPVIDNIETSLTSLPLPHDVQARVAGIPFVRVDAVRDLVGDQLRFLPLTALVYLIILIVMFRWLWGVILPVAVVAISILWSMALIVVTGHSVNIVNNVLPTLLFVIGISDSIHLLSRYREELALGRDHDTAVAIMFRRLLLACLLTSVTTAVGVASLVVSHTPILRDFGILAGIGVMLAYVSTMSVTPTVLLFVKPPPVALKKPGAGDRVDRMLAAAALYIVNRPRRVIAFALALTVAFGIAATGLKVDSYLMAVYPESHPNTRINKLVEEAFGGVIPMDVVFISTTDEDLRRDADLLRRVSEVQRLVEGQPGVGRTVSMVDLLAAVYRAVSEQGLDRRHPRVLPLNDATVAQLQLVADISGDEVRQQFDRFVADKGRRMRIMSRVSDLGARNINAMVTRLQAEIDKIMYGRDDVEVRLTGDGVVGSASIDRFVSDLASSVFTAGLIIFATIGLLFRSIKIGLISILPSATPLLATLAMMALLGIFLDVTSIIVFSMALGLAVDHSIHILARYREERLDGAGCKAAVVRAYRGSGRAVILAAVLLLVGFLVLLSSSFMPTRRTGLLSAVCVGGALIGVLVLLPAMLALFDKGRKAARAYRTT